MDMSCPYCDRWRRYHGHHGWGLGGLALGLGLGYLIGSPGYYYPHYYYTYPGYYSGYYPGYYIRR